MIRDQIVDDGEALAHYSMARMIDLQEGLSQQRVQLQQNAKAQANPEPAGSEDK